MMKHQKTDSKITGAFLVPLALFLVVFIFGTAYAINIKNQGYRAVQNTPIAISDYSPCQIVTDTGPGDVFVPTNTQYEWSTFVNNKPSYVSLTGCGSIQVPISVSVYAGTIPGASVVPTQLNGVAYSGGALNPSAGSALAYGYPDNRPNVTFDWTHGTITEGWVLSGGHDYIAKGGSSINALVTFSDGTTDLITNIDPGLVKNVGIPYQLPGDWTTVTGSAGCVLPVLWGDGDYYHSGGTQDDNGHYGNLDENAYPPPNNPSGNIPDCAGLQVGNETNPDVLHLGNYGQTSVVYKGTPPAIDYGNIMEGFTVFLNHTSAAKSSGVQDLNGSITNLPVSISTGVSAPPYNTGLPAGLYEINLGQTGPYTIPGTGSAGGTWWYMPVTPAAPNTSIPYSSTNSRYATNPASLVDEMKCAGRGFKYYSFDIARYVGEFSYICN